MRFDFSTYDLQLVDASTQALAGILLDKGFGEHHFIESTAQQKLATLKFKAFGPLTILEYGVGASVQVHAPKVSNAYFLQVILTGRSVVQGQGTERLLTAGDSLMIMPNTHFESDDSADCKKLMVKIPTDFLHQTLLEFGYLSPAGAIQFDSAAHRFPMAGPLFNLLNDMLQQDKSTLNERALVYYCKLLNSAILNIFNSNVRSDSVSNASLHRYIARIRHYVLDNITTDITIDELASLCQISRKSLYNLFERETGLTPSTYVRRLKLESVHAELKNNERIKNVTQVALKYGFTNLGRFSAQYREQIGELPSKTLRDFSY
ncbi:AraC family transcriptional regulator [Marinomonas sp. M1K-6]|uniref:AraC family transcriptional regulator n=1 Tax=Marinomonas profundi TaxID=2726122 RepID=A0A847R0L6_9GAMM|nr:AraC family transcriptional regulator [Marinomonas profundi]NLQ17042.1 AraC family transcriptional regulator [Marinomonas profundi]UDV04757.1 AraC family transcriptional regulator [Marinomonas profundi]